MSKVEAGGTMQERVEIMAEGLVQGVGFRYFVLRRASGLDLTGYTKNEYDGRVLTVAEGPRPRLEELVCSIKIGPNFAQVTKIEVDYLPATGEFKSFEVRG